MVAIVTGARRGLGAAIVEGLRADGVEVVGFIGDVRNPTDVSSVQGLEVDILINNAAIYENGTVQNTGFGVWAMIIETNLTGAFLMIQAVLPGMIKRGYGRIVNIGSFGGVANPPGSAAYNVSKAGLIGLTKSTASENVKHGITCNMIAPGAIDTGIFSRFDDDHKERLLKRVPIGRAATVEEIVNPVRWLVSKEASYLTGQVINVSGGMA